MSLSVYLFPAKESPATEDDEYLYYANYTHNIIPMADKAGLYEPIWRANDTGVQTAGQLIGPLTEGLARLLDSPSDYEALNPANGWGTYESFVRWVRDLLAACQANPNASLSVSG